MERWTHEALDITQGLRESYLHHPYSCSHKFAANQLLTSVLGHTDYQH